MDKTDSPKQYESCMLTRGPSSIAATREFVRLKAEQQAVRDICCKGSDSDCFGTAGWGELDYYKKVIDGKNYQCVKLSIDPANVHCEKPKDTSEEHSVEK